MFCLLFPTPPPWKKLFCFLSDEKIRAIALNGIMLEELTFYFFHELITRNLNSFQLDSFDRKFYYPHKEAAGSDFPE